MQLTKHQLKKRKKGICVACRCSNKRANPHSFCHKHRIKRWADNNPEKYTFFVLRNNAKRRNKFFDLTFNQFLDFLKENPDYMKMKGTRVKSLQIDRIENDKGYTQGNIRAITLKENVWKQHNVDYQTEDPSAVDYCPF